MNSPFRRRQLGKAKSWVNYKGKTIQLDYEPRTGTCTDCRTYGEHNVLHHELYIDSDPMAHTVELCQKCHGSRHSKVSRFTI
jgi:5-methylcytosine-specific restriction endonuclease McrA